MSSHNETSRFIQINTQQQAMHCYENDILQHTYSVSTGKNGLGEREGSECTPRGWHRIYRIIGLDKPINSVFISREWTGEIYSRQLSATHPHRDWILTRILQLEGLEPGRNKGGDVDSLKRYIYIHGTPDTTPLGIPGSRGCIRMHNEDIVQLATWVTEGTRVCIE
jgi:lipoprotein-anchoring transpeptidase ErfK/SrfK